MLHSTFSRMKTRATAQVNVGRRSFAWCLPENFRGGNVWSSADELKVACSLVGGESFTVRTGQRKSAGEMTSIRAGA